MATAVPYYDFDLTTLSLGPFQAQERRPAQHLETTATRPVHRTVTHYDRYRKAIITDTYTTETYTKYTTKPAMSIPAHFRLHCPNIKLVGSTNNQVSDDTIKICKVLPELPWAVHCAIAKTSPIAAFLVQLNRHGEVLLDQAQFKYGSYRGFVLEPTNRTSHKSDIIMVKFHGNDQLNASLQTRIGQTVDQMVIKVSAIWQAGYLPNGQTHHDMVMKVSLVSL